MLVYSGGAGVKLPSHRNPIGEIRFAGLDQFGFPGSAIPCPLAILGDGVGNFWVVDVDPTNGRWGVVFYVCHDPPVVAIQAANLATFIGQATDQESSALSDFAGPAVTNIWTDDPWVVPLEVARPGDNQSISAFIETLPETYGVADLRPAQVGSGFRWDVDDPAIDILRAHGELIFAVRRKPPGRLRSWFRRA